MEGQGAWVSHAAFMNSIEREGFVVLGGPLGGRLTVYLFTDGDARRDHRAALS
jgi:hypothetical protein